MNTVPQLVSQGTVKNSLQLSEDKMYEFPAIMKKGTVSKEEEYNGNRKKWKWTTSCFGDAKGVVWILGLWARFLEDGPLAHDGFHLSGLGKNVSGRNLERFIRRALNWQHKKETINVGNSVKQSELPEKARSNGAQGVGKSRFLCTNAHSLGNKKRLSSGISYLGR